VILNRYHKPLGHYTSAFVNYTDYAVRIRGLGAKTAQQLSWEGRDNLDTIYLYQEERILTGGKAEWDAYQQRLARLAALTVET